MPRPANIESHIMGSSRRSQKHWNNRECLDLKIFRHLRQLMVYVFSFHAPPPIAQWWLVLASHQFTSKTFVMFAFLNMSWHVAPEQSHLMSKTPMATKHVATRNCELSLCRASACSLQDNNLPPEMERIGTHSRPISHEICTWPRCGETNTLTTGAYHQRRMFEPVCQFMITMPRLCLHTPARGHPCTSGSSREQCHKKPEMCCVTASHPRILTATLLTAHSSSENNQVTLTAWGMSDSSRSSRMPCNVVSNMQPLFQPLQYPTLKGGRSPASPATSWHLPKP